MLAFNGDISIYIAICYVYQNTKEGFKKKKKAKENEISNFILEISIKFKMLLHHKGIMRKKMIFLKSKKNSKDT